jgi:hypothetical protein
MPDGPAVDPISGNGLCRVRQGVELRIDRRGFS